VGENKAIQASIGPREVFSDGRDLGQVQRLMRGNRAEWDEKEMMDQCL
jgi:hypothetical protein